MGFTQPITNAIGVTRTLNTIPRKQYFQHNSRRYPKSTKLSVEGGGICFSAQVTLDSKLELTTTTRASEDQTSLFKCLVRLKRCKET